MTAILKKSLLCLWSLSLILSLPCLSQAQSNQDPIVYIVKKRDTLSKIGRKYGVKVKEITQLNSLDNPNRISEGQVILIPQKPVRAIDVAKTTEVVATRPRRTKQIAMKGADASDAIFEESYSSKQPNKSVKKVDYVQVRKEEPTTDPFPIIENDVMAFEEDIVKKKEENPNAGFLGGSITSWFVVNLDAEVSADLGPIKGTNIDLQDALNADDDLTIPVVNVWLAPFNNPWLIFQFEYMEFDISGRNTIDESLTFEGVTFSAKDTVAGDADVQRISAWVELNPFQGDWGYIGLLVGGEYINIEASFNNEFSGSVSGTVPSLPSSISGITLPTEIAKLSGKTVSRSITLDDVAIKEDVDAGTVALGGQARFNINEDLFVSGRIRAFSYEVSDIDFSFVDLQAELNYVLLDFITLAGGYRALFIEAENNEVRGELSMHGPFIKGGIAF